MKPLRRRILALLGVLAIVPGSLMPGVAVPCAERVLDYFARFRRP